ncbi:hypothetical protein [Bacillus coahuilensis]|uniref:hypothetical protein n=1 Tax=Bacillus coahuilensis TaxID=408580 RepID=UPI0001850C5C|nr:hypothetical protein [Bacillus coahuilensis]
MPGLIWLLFVFYSIFLAPGASGSDDQIFINLISGQFETVPSLVVVVFSLLGLYPLLFAKLLLVNDNGKVPAWPFIIASFGLGAFSLLLYYQLHQFFPSHKRIERTPKKLKRFLNTRLFFVILFILTIICFIPITTNPSLTDYYEAFNQSHLVSVMTVDFFILLVLSYVECKRRGLSYSFLAFLPVVGPLLLLWLHKS